MISFERLTSNQESLSRMRELNQVFADAFEDEASYAKNKPSDAYLMHQLEKPETFVWAALHENQVIGGLVAYELPKLEQARSEIYLYDLAVLGRFRRKGVARELIRRLRQDAKNVGAWVVFVQADYGDDAAINLYESLGSREEVLHYDLEFDSTE